MPGHRPFFVRPRAGYAGPVILLIGLAAIVCAYLVGSIPFGYLIARARGIDIRTKGSGNIGATNVWRVMGPRFGLPCFLLDVLKGLVPSLVIAWQVYGPQRVNFSPEQATLLQIAVAVAAVLGHMFPVWLRFKGGKGVATSFGALLGVYPVFTAATAAALLAWIVSALITRMVGISSCIAAVALAGAVLVMRLSHGSIGGLTIPHASTTHAAFAAALAAVVIYKHRANLARTLAGTEPKIGGKRAAQPKASSHA